MARIPAAVAPTDDKAKVFFDRYQLKKG